MRVQAIHRKDCGKVWWGQLGHEIKARKYDNNTMDNNYMDDNTMGSSTMGRDTVLRGADVCKAASLCRQVLSRLPRPEFVVGNMCELDVHWVYIFFCLISFQFPRKACYSFDQGFGDGK